MCFDIKALPSAELHIMEALWVHSNIGYNEIIQLAAQNGKSIHVKRIHRLLHQLEEKKLIVVTDTVKVARTTMKKYSASISREVYLAALLESNPVYNEKQLPGMLCYLLKHIKKPETADKLFEIIQTVKEQRR